MKSLTLAVAFGLVAVGSASAELAVRNVDDGMIAVSPGGTPFVAYLQGKNVEIAARDLENIARSTSGSRL